MVKTWLCGDRAGPRACLLEAAVLPNNAFPCCWRLFHLGSVTWNWRQSDSKAYSLVASWLEFKVSGIGLKRSSLSQESGHALGFGNGNYGVLWSGPQKLELASFIWLYLSGGRQLSKAWLWTVWGTATKPWGQSQKNSLLTNHWPKGKLERHESFLNWSIISLN